MIKKYIIGKPIETEAVVESIATENGCVPFFSTENEGVFSLELGEDDIVYGLGQQVRGINKRGWKYVCNNFDNPNHQEDTASLYGAHNFIIVSGKEPFGAFFDTPSKITFDIGYSHRNEIKISAEYPDMYVYIITGENEEDIVKQFRKIIGKSYIAPKWAFGYGQSRWGYKSADDIRFIADNYQKNDIPIDMIYLDIDYMERFKDFSINEETFPDFESFVDEMKSRKIHLIPIIDAGVKIEEGYDVYEEGVKENYFCKDENGNDFVAAVWPGRVHFPDMLKPETRKWFGKKYEFLLNKGIDGFWNDMNEPALFYTEKRLEDTIKEVNRLAGTNMGINEYFKLTGMIMGLSNHPEDYKLFYHDVNGEKIRHDRVHNLFGYNMTRAAGETFEELSPDKKILMFSRSSYIGAHRYGGIWQGDNRSWWSHLLMNIQMTCNLNMVGFLYTGADLGGFGSEATEDLVLRWLQFAIFTPLMRNHSALGTREQEVFRFDNIDACKKMIEIRYSLIPYLYSEYLKAVQDDGLMFRPLGFVFDDNTSKNVEDQILFGDEIMLAPVYTQNAKGRYVWLPEEMMMVKMKSATDISTEIMPKGHHYIDVELDELVFFIRKDKAIPLCDSARSVDEIDMNTKKMIGYLGYEYKFVD